MQLSEASKIRECSILRFNRAICSINKIIQYFNMARYTVFHVSTTTIIRQITSTE